MAQKELHGKKKLMFEALKSQMGMVSSAVKQVGIHRRTHYLWMKTDSVYKEAVNGIEDYILDIVEKALLKNILDGNVQAQIFYLKTKGQKRGFIEVQRNVNLNIEPAVINIIRPIENGEHN